MPKIAATIALAALTLPLLAGCAFTAGPVVSEERSIDDVTAVVLETAGDLTITRGEPSLTISAGSAVISSLTAEIRDGVLYLGQAPGIIPNWSRDNVRYALQLPTIESLLIEGSGDVVGDFAGADDVEISIEGSGDVEASGIDADAVTVSIGGSGDIELSGATTALRASIEGSGDIDADDLSAVDATTSIDGSGEIRVHATGTLDASISGSGTVTYSGGAKVTSSIDGSGEIVQD